MEESFWKRLWTCRLTDYWWWWWWWCNYIYAGWGNGEILFRTKLLGQISGIPIAYAGIAALDEVLKLRQREKRKFITEIFVYEVQRSDLLSCTHRNCTTKIFSVWSQFPLMSVISNSYWKSRRPRHFSRYSYSSYSIRTERSGDRIPVKAKFSVPVQTGPGIHPVFY